MEDLFQLILFALFILFGLLSGIKKKKPTSQSKSRPTQRPQQPVRRAPPQPRSRTLPTPTPTSARPTERVPARPHVEPRQAERQPVSRIEELFELLQERVEQRQEVREPEPVAPPQPVVKAREPRPAPASERRTQVQQRSEAPKPSRRTGLELNPRTARQGIILAEVLGPPKGLSE